MFSETNLNAEKEKEKEISVGLQCVVCKVDDIEQRVVIEFSFWGQLKHYEKTGLGDTFARVENPGWRPKFAFFNLTHPAVVVEETFYARESTGDLYMFLNFIITIQEHLDLRKFPFDRQTCEIKFYLINARYVPFSKEARQNVPPSFPDEYFPQLDVELIAESQLWLLHSADANVSALQGGGSEFLVHISFERKTDYYLSNILLPYFFIGLVSFGVYSIPLAEDPSSRINFMITIILTAIAFKFVTSGLVPKTSYLTLLDKYITAGFLLFTVTLAKDAALALAIQAGSLTRSASAFDTIYTCTALGLWILVHLLIFIAGKISSLSRYTVRTPWDKVRLVVAAAQQIVGQDVLNVGEMVTAMKSDQPEDRNRH